MVWADVAGLIHNILQSEQEEDFTAIGWPIVGRFKWKVEELVEM